VTVFLAWLLRCQIPRVFQSRYHKESILHIKIQNSHTSRLALAHETRRFDPASRGVTGHSGVTYGRYRNKTNPSLEHHQMHRQIIFRFKFASYCFMVDFEDRSGFIQLVCR
jgi:hypothetical protein